MTEQSPISKQPVGAVIYARVSTDEQAKGYSLPTQIEGCSQYASLKGYSVLSIFTDDYTGESLDRPGLDEMRAFIRANQVHAIIILDVDRWARKSIYQMLLEDEFSHAGLKIEYVMGQYADTDEGRLQKQIKGAIAEYEKAKIMERSKRGKRGKAKSGYVIVGSRPPYGYKTVSEPHKSWLEIDEEEARIVCLIFLLYVFGENPGTRMSLNGIAAYLTKLQIPTRGDKHKHVAKKQGFGVWTYAMIRHIVMNRTYIGEWYYGKTHMIDDGKKATRKATSKCGTGKQVARPQEEWIKVKVPAIIDRKTFDLAQQRIEENKFRMGRQPLKKPHLLAKRLRCSRCGYIARAKSYNHWRYYECNGKHRNPPVCDMKPYKAELVDNIVWEWVKDTVQHPENIAKGLRTQQTELNKQNAVLRERLDLIQDRLSDTEVQLAKLLDLYLSGDFPKEVLTQRKNDLEKVRGDLRREYDGLSAQLDTKDLTNDQVAQIEEFCADIRAGFDSATFEDKQRYFELLEVQGTLADENGERVVYISCRLGKQRLVLAATLPSSNTGETSKRLCGCLPADRSR